MDADSEMQTVHRPLELDPKRAGRLERTPYGIIDIGSNSVRLVVYDQLGRAPLPRFNEKSLCRLGDGLAETGLIAADGYRRTVEAVRRFRAIADAMGVSRLDATATEAVRRAANGRKLVEAIREEAGIEVRILSGAEEARFATLGVISGFFRPDGVVGDMGGGSLEIAEALDDRVGEAWVSLPLGALPVESILQDRGNAKKRIDAILKESLPVSLARHTFFAVGGGWRTFAKAHMLANDAPVPVVHGYRIAAADARFFAKSVLRLSPAKIEALPGVSRRRARTFPAAAMMLDRVLKHLAPKHVVFSALGLREGWIYSQLETDERYLDPLVEGAQLIGLPAARVPDFATALVAWTAGLEKERTPAEMRLRVAICALSDIGWRDHPDIRAEESYRRVLQFPFIGLDHSERAFLAVAIHARYAGRLDAAYLSGALGLLSPPERRRAEILGRAILLGYRLSGGTPSVLVNSRLLVGPKRLRLEVGQAARVPDSEAVAERLSLLAAAMKVKSIEITQIETGHSLLKIRG
ncbi:exopolyphosphatase [Mesorhizobium sp. VK23B]|uniref:Exopolyphosphatase n=1 Tax=Mesorhizobium dulcispinae TaxID=3072316 RepID=A0ABU4X8B7_9HYPH|nr:MULTISPECIES: exopolyphosphatase [unclassified Mesorhizobium]MDX8464656.1 exopolyphosphatase [Mesorhizobium sp. VK23B]MDX8471042.1 exopolyphosphatase [Mesorhizobium sp. VK23A]